MVLVNTNYFNWFNEFKFTAIGAVSTYFTKA